MASLCRILSTRCNGTHRLLADARGAIMVEYTVLIGAIALIGSVGLILVGAAVMHNFNFVRGLLLCPLP